MNTPLHIQKYSDYVTSEEDTIPFFKTTKKQRGREMREELERRKKVLGFTASW